MSSIYISIILFIITFNTILSQELPKLLPLPLKSELSEGSSFRLLCYPSTGTKPLFYQWSKDGEILANNPHSSYKIETFNDNSQFGIEKVTRSDSGNYSCIVRNAFGTDIQSALLTVKVAAKWVLEPKDIRISSADDVIIECRADGEPKPKIVWITSEGVKIEGERLQIRGFITGNEAKFQCIADNGVNDILRKEFTVFVNGMLSNV